jgi:putative ABC transport system permease protein
MLRLALLSARGRLGTFAGAFVALAASSALVMAGGMPFQSALSTHPPVERYAGAAAVVTGQQIVGVDHDVPLGERARVDSALAARLAAVPGVRAAIADVSVPAVLGSRDSFAHGWSSAALTPYVLSAGRAPAGPARPSPATAPGWARGSASRRPPALARSPSWASPSRATPSGSGRRSS